MFPAMYRPGPNRASFLSDRDYWRPPTSVCRLERPSPGRHRPIDGKRPRALARSAATSAVGAGRWERLVEGLLAPARREIVIMLEPQPSREISALIAAAAAQSALTAAAEASASLLAVKPAGLTEVSVPGSPLMWRAHRYRLDHGGPTRLSSKASPAHAPRLVRAIQTTPAAIGAASRSRCRTTRLARQLEPCSAPVGDPARSNGSRRALCDAVTAVSAPAAPICSSCRALAGAGRGLGLPGDCAARLARATVAGSGELPQPLAARSARSAP